jgi:hypothetical protein
MKSYSINRREDMQTKEEKKYWLTYQEDRIDRG